MLKKNHKKLLIASLLCTIFISSLFIDISAIFNNKEFKDQQSKLKNSSESYDPNLIVYFNSSSYLNQVEQRFEYFGGIVKKSWNNNIFNSFSGFSGNMPLEQNKTDFQLEFPNAFIESDEIVEAQMNYAAFQTGAINSSWDINGYNGDTNSSIAVLDTGVNLSNPYLKNKVIAWEDILNGNMMNDVNGHGTFISSIISGTGITSYNSSEPNNLVFNKNYTHSDIFGYDINPGNYSIKICTVNLSLQESYFYINSSWNKIIDGIDEFWVELYYEGDLVNSSSLSNGIWKNINYSISEDETGLYDVFIKYHKELNEDPKFRFNLNGKFIPESYIPNFSRYTGIANGTKLVNYKVLNQSAKGFMSDLISGLESVIENRTNHHIISTCISIATLGEDNNAILDAIDEVIESGIMVVIAAGNYGVQTSNSLNTIAENRNAIVVGAINDNDQVTFYSSMGKNIGKNVIKPDIVAPGGSQLAEHRSIISADANSNKTTTMYGTSISAAIVSSVLNLLVEAKWSNWNQWNIGDLKNKVNILKAMLLMTATETLSSREDNPNTEINEAQSQYSPRRYLNPINLTDRAGLTDIHEGYGRLNVMTAIDALTKSLEPNISVNGHLASSTVNPLKAHAFARQVELEKNHQYLFNLTNLEPNSIFDIYLYSNNSNKWGEPILLASSRRTFNAFDYLYFTPKYNETNPIVVIKAIQGESNFTLNITSVSNMYDPILDIPEISYNGGEMNTTVLSLRKIEGETPNNNISLDRYRFFIEYNDNDTANIPPQEVFLHIVELSKNYTMTQLSPQDINYTDGAVFATQYIELSNNTYHYYFVAKDGLREARFPELNNLSIKIEFPDNIKTIPIIHSFNNGFNNWTVQGTGWNLLKQDNINDNRSGIYNNEWRTIYFGTHHNYPKNYTYQPILFDDPFPNGTLTSPFYDLTDVDDFSELEARFGLRMSLNSNDEINLLVNINGSGWELEKTYANVEKEWYIDILNLSEYTNSYLQLRFSANLDDEADLINYKGFMVDYFSIENYTNNYIPQTSFNVNNDLKIKQDLEFHKILFNLNYFDRDNNYPEFVKIEIDGNNYSMVNHLGDWNSTNYMEGYKGIKFIRSISLIDFTNTSFRFHVSDGNNINSTDWYNEDGSLISYTIPVPSQSNVFQETIPIGYDFKEDLNNFYITGTPTPKENTAWLRGDNNWHNIKKFNKTYLYGGLGNGYSETFRGYGYDWDAQLISKPILVEDEKKVYLQYDYQIDLQNEAGVDEDDRDKCVVEISNDYGSTWKKLKTYYYNSEDVPLGNESIDIAEYSNDAIMLKFSIKSNDNPGATPGFGWLLSDIYVGYDIELDHVAPSLKFITPQNNQVIDSVYKIKINITDNIGIDESRLALYLNGRAISNQKINYDNNTGILSYDWNTKSFSDGVYEIRIIAYDIEGNKIEDFISVKVDNLINNLLTWLPIIILGLFSIAGISLIVYLKKNKNISFKDKFKELRGLSPEDLKNRRKTIELVKSLEKNQLENPLTLHCKFCDSWFYSDRFDIMCPHCGRDQIYAVYKCLNCGKWEHKDEPGTDYYCSKCDDIKLIRREKDEIQKLLAEEKRKVLKEFDKKKENVDILNKK